MTKKWFYLSLLVSMIVGLFFFGCGKKSTNRDDSTGVGLPPAPPTLLSLANGTTGVAASVSLSWNPSNGALRYELQVSTSDSFFSFVLDKSNITSTSYVVSQLAETTMYFWRVNASNDYGTSDWSIIWSFTTGSGTAPAPPILLSPADGATEVTNSPTLRWNASAWAGYYTLQVSIDSLFSNFVINKLGITATSFTASKLSYSTTYYWRVNAINDYGTSAWSDVWSFNTESMSGGWDTYNTSNSGLVDDRVYAIAIDKSGNKWFGTWSGVSKFDGGNWTTYDPSESGTYVEAIAIDASGNKWFAASGGVSKFDGINWTVYNSTNSGLPGYGVSTIAIDASGNKWFGTYGGGVAKFDDNSWTVYTVSNSGLAHNSIWAITVDASGNLWFGTAAGGVSMFDGSSWITYNTSNSGLADDGVLAISIDASGDRWFGTWDGGVSRFDGVVWTTYNVDNSGLSRNSVWAIAVDAPGNLWFGTGHGGVCKFDGNNWTIYDTSNSGLAHDYVRAITIDASDNKWFGTFGGGVSMLHE